MVETAEALVERFGSPLYVYDAERVRAAYRSFCAAFAYPRTEIHFAIVCNKNRHLVAALSELGAGIHANTPGDAHAALSAAVPPARIVYSGTNLTRSGFRFLIERGIGMNLDSIDQLRDFVECGGSGAVGLRLLIDEEDRRNRIGVTRAELPAALALARSANLRLSGLHMYAGTNTRREARFLRCFDRLLEAARDLPDLDYVDIGGGFGVAYSDSQRELDLGTLGQSVGERMQALSHDFGRTIRLIVEPGRTLVASAGSLLMTVVSSKERGGRRYVGVDSTIGNIVVPSVYHVQHRVLPVAPRGPVLDVPTDICGCTTHSRDFIAQNCRLPALAAGDLLQLCDVGAYGYAMSSHFLNCPRPAEVVMDAGEAILTTRRETFDDLLATQVC